MENKRSRVSFRLKVYLTIMENIKNLKTFSKVHISSKLEREIKFYFNILRSTSSYIRDG